MTHTELVVRAEHWLLRNRKCAFAFSELTGATSEIPDAIGWKKHGGSILVECKTSRSDFLNDGKKTFRRNPKFGMGRMRYYMCQPDVIKPEDLMPDLLDVSVPLPDLVPKVRKGPWLGDWGLLYCHPKMIRVVKKPKPCQWSTQDEMWLMHSALRRLHLRGRIPEIYEEYMPPKQRT